MNPNTMTIEAIRDYYLEREGWRYIWLSDRGDMWENRDGTQVFSHPIPATLDEAAKLPEGWEFTEVWRMITGGLLAEANTPTGRFKQATGDTELLARFRLRLACTIADEGTR